MECNGASKKKQGISFSAMKIMVRAAHFICIIIGCTFLPKFAGAQREAENWLFGTSVWMNFSSGQPVTLPVNTSNSFLFEFGSTCVSDRHGKLLFYGDRFLRDRTHQSMPGTGPSGLFACNDIATTQQFLTLPLPGNDSMYYVFYFMRTATSDVETKFGYAVVNMNKRNGLGDVIQKDVMLLNGVSICPRITATLHCNKKDIWIIGHLRDSDKYFSLLLSASGISTIPVYSTGAFIPEGNFPIYYRGYVKVSPKGDKLASGFFEGFDMVELLDFNNQTGMLTNHMTLTVKPSWANPIPSFSGQGPWGIEFSPSSRYLYVNGQYSTNAFIHVGVLQQFDLSSNNQSTIQASRFQVDSMNGYHHYGMQLAVDGKIYRSRYENWLDVIENPDEPELQCNYKRERVYTGSVNRFQLPFFLQNYFRYPIISTGNCQFQNIDFSIQNIPDVSSIEWDFGDPASGLNNVSNSFTPTHIFTSEGTYEVKAVLYNTNGCGADTVRKLIHAGPFKVYLGPDASPCVGDTLLLHMNIPDANYLWSTNSFDTLSYITQSGTYWVRVNIGNCVASDTINVSFISRPEFSLGTDTTICSGQSFILAPVNGQFNASYTWNTGVIDPTITVDNDGSYWLELTDNVSGCKYRDTLNVQFKDLPEYSLGKDTSLCEGNSLSLNAEVTGATEYMWSTGNTNSAVNITQTNIYWADVTKDQCTYRDSIEVIFKPLPVVNLGKDTTLCEDQSLLLDAGNSGSNYLWKNNSTGQTFNVTAPGGYFVKVTMYGCSSSDTIEIEYDLKPEFTLGGDFGICDGQTIFLQPVVESSSSVSYLWQNGSTLSSFSVTQPGLYSLDITNYCGTETDEINVIKGVCKLYVPTAFSPNGDGLNEIFKAGYGENVSDFQLDIYNRWGERIFHTKDINKGWNGKYNGIVQPTGIFVWLIKYKTVSDPKESLLKGTVMLIR